MNFFEHQDRARSHTGKLILLFVFAVVVLVIVTSFLVSAIVAFSEQQAPPQFGLSLLQSDIFLVVAACVVGVVIFGAFYRIAQLRRGGRVIAESMGGRLLERNQASADELKILNVVEEMALASGVPVPPVYLIPDDAINAFAAGYHLQDAVIGITRGAVRLLKRDELQGVVAHEFSHIFNGDMRLNLRLVGWLHGLLLIGLIGRSILRMPPRRSRNRKGDGSAVLIGLVLAALGYVGILFGNLIKSAVSRQREFLADASAVQFTRNPDGICNALKKIGGYPLGSRMLTSETTEINHMLFGEATYGLFVFSWFATHPPLKERIKRIDPRWDGKLVNPDRKPDVSWSTLPREEQAGFQQGDVAGNHFQLAERFVESVGSPTGTALETAQAHLAAIPDTIRQQLEDPLSTVLSMWALLLIDSDEATAKQQLALLQPRCGPAVMGQLNRQLELLRQLPHNLRFAIVELAQSQLAQLSSQQRDNFLHTLDLLVQADGKLSVYEWGFGRLLQHNLDARWGSDKRIDLASCLADCQTLLAALARAGHDDDQAAQIAFQQSYVMLDESALPLAPITPLDFAALDRALQRLTQLKPLQKPKLLKAMVLCVQHDGHVSDDEMTLLRVVAALLDCPVPPLRG